MTAIVKLTRKNKPLWEFYWDGVHNGYVHKTKNKTTYKIFFDNCINPSKHGIEPDIWIGRLVTQNGERFWVTAEKDIKAESLIMLRGQYNFK